MRIPAAKSISSKYMFSKLKVDSTFLPAASLLLLLVPSNWSWPIWSQFRSTRNRHHISLF